MIDLSDVICPDCRAPVRHHDDGLRCSGCSRVFDLIAGAVPSLIPSRHEGLKKEIMEWWSKHNMDLDWSRPQNVEKGTWEYFRETDRRWFNWHRPFLHQKYPMMHEILDMRAYKGKKVIDIGCGVGTMFEQWSALGAEITGIDMAPKHVYLTHRRATMFNVRGRVFHGDAERLPFADRTFDFAYSWGVLHHTPDTRGAIQEVFRVLKPGGRFFIMVYHKHSWHYWYNKMFKWGVARGKLLTMSPKQIADRTSDGVFYGGNPLAQWLTREELRSMTTEFEDVKLYMVGHADTIRLFPMKKFPIGKLLLPTSIANRLMKSWGHLAVIEGRRPA